MPELEILEAKVPVRTPRLAPEPEPAQESVATRLAPVATWLNGPVFSRARDIFEVLELPIREIVEADDLVPVCGKPDGKRERQMECRWSC